MRAHLAWIRRFWRDYHRFFPVLIVLTILSAVVTLAYPLLFRYILDGLKVAIEKGGGEKAGRYADLVLLLLLVGAGRSLRNLYPMTRAWVNCLIEMGVRKHYFARVIEKSHRFFLRFRTGDLVTRLTDDISNFPKIAWFMCSGIFRAFESVTILLACVLAMVLLVDWRLGLVALSPLPVTMVLFYFVQVSLGRRMLENQQAISRTNDLLESSFSGVRILKAYRAEERQREKLRTLLGERIEIEMAMIRMWALLDMCFFGLTNVGRILTISVGGYWVLDGSLTFGQLFAIWLYVDQLWRPLLDLPQLLVTGKQAFVCMDRLEEIADFEPGRVDGEGGTVAVDGIERLDLEDVSFRYDEEKPGCALSRVSLTLLRGEKLAVVGPVGAGKSTLARLISGELRSTSGRIRVNGSDFADLDVTSYRKRVGYIPQEALLFSDTVRENVAFGRDVDEDRVRAALALAQVEAEVDAFPKGLDELLGQRGVRVSGGQRQRIAVARALVADPDLLIMDDVTAALDAENEEALWDALAARADGVTAVVVTHRIATARHADRILVLDRGRVVDSGRHEDLLTRCALYARLGANGE